MRGGSDIKRPASFFVLNILWYINITISEVGILKVKLDQQKTCFIPLLPIPLELIEKYRNKSEYVFPIQTNKQMNDLLKSIGEACSIRKILTMHVARHTFVALMLNKGMSIASVAKMLGYTDLRII